MNYYYLSSKMDSGVQRNAGDDFDLHIFFYSTSWSLLCTIYFVFVMNNKLKYAYVRQVHFKRLKFMCIFPWEVENLTTLQFQTL